MDNKNNSLFNYDCIKITLEELKNNSTSPTLFEKIISFDNNESNLELKKYKSSNYFFSFLKMLGFIDYSFNTKENVIKIKKTELLNKIKEDGYIEINGINKISDEIFKIEKIPELFEILKYLYEHKNYIKANALKVSFFDKDLKLSVKKRISILNIAVLFKLINKTGDYIYLSQLGIDFIKYFFKIIEKKENMRELLSKKLKKD